MLNLHIYSKKEKESDVKSVVSKKIENKIRKRLDYKDSLFTTYAVVMCIENMILEDFGKKQFYLFLEDKLNSEDVFDYMCIDPIIYVYLWLLAVNKDKDYSKLKIFIDNVEQEVSIDLFSEIVNMLLIEYKANKALWIKDIETADSTVFYEDKERD